MKKLICVFLSILLIVSLSGLVFAAPAGPQFTMQPQSLNYPEFSVAIYSVKASGTNLSATWFMEWQGETYTISNIGGTSQKWEGYAGESYGARQLDDNTFAFIFEGIGAELNGANIWCVIEDGHNDITSQKARIMVGNQNTPPTILDIPPQLTVEQGAEAEIRCIAQAPGDTQLSFLWYETDTGRLEDIRAVNRGTETSDFLLCDTATAGTRYYICMVETSQGGVAYSSIVPVTVTEKAESPTQPSAGQTVPTEAPTAPPEATAPTEATVPTETAGSNTTDPNPQPTKPTQPPVQPDPTKPAQPAAPGNQETDNQGLPWWSLILIGLAGAGAGVGAAVLLIRKNQNTK